MNKQSTTTPNKSNQNKYSVKQEPIREDNKIYTMNEFGRIVTYKHQGQGVDYFFGYDEHGNVCSISNSTGWTWTRAHTPSFQGWVVRNYFDRWEVNEADCGSVYVDQSGIYTTKGSATLLGLPEINH